MPKERSQFVRPNIVIVRRVTCSNNSKKTVETSPKPNVLNSEESVSSPNMEQTRKNIQVVQPTSSNKQQATSNIPQTSSNIQQTSSNMQQSSFNIQQTSSNMQQSSSNIQQISSKIPTSSNTKQTSLNMPQTNLNIQQTSSSIQQNSSNQQQLPQTTTPSLQQASSKPLDVPTSVDITSTEDSKSAKKLTNSWASNFLQSIGQFHNTKPIKVNLSLSKNKIVKHGGSANVKNETPLQTKLRVPARDFFMSSTNDTSSTPVDDTNKFKQTQCEQQSKETKEISIKPSTSYTKLQYDAVASTSQILTNLNTNLKAAIKEPNKIKTVIGNRTRYEASLPSTSLNSIDYNPGAPDFLESDGTQIKNKSIIDQHQNINVGFPSLISHNTQYYVQSYVGNYELQDSNKNTTIGPIETQNYPRPTTPISYFSKFLFQADNSEKHTTAVHSKRPKVYTISSSRSRSSSKDRIQDYKKSNTKTSIKLKKNDMASKSTKDSKTSVKTPVDIIIPSKHQKIYKISSSRSRSSSKDKVQVCEKIKNKTLTKPKLNDMRTKFSKDSKTKASVETPEHTTIPSKRQKVYDVSSSGSNISKDKVQVYEKIKTKTSTKPEINDMATELTRDSDSKDNSKSKNDYKETRRGSKEKCKTNRTEGKKSDKESGEKAKIIPSKVIKVVSNKYRGKKSKTREDNIGIIKSKLADIKRELDKVKLKTQLLKTDYKKSGKAKQRDNPTLENTPLTDIPKQSLKHKLTELSYRPEQLLKKRIRRSSVNMDNCDSGVRHHISPIKNVVKVPDQFLRHPRIKPPKDHESYFDLRSKLSRFNLNHCKQPTIKYEAPPEFTKEKQRDNLVITVKGTDENIHGKSPESKVTKSKPKSKKIKKIKLVINLVCPEPGESSTESSSTDSDFTTESSSTDSDFSDDVDKDNTDLSFLDDFNVDEIVRSLKHSPKRDILKQDKQILETNIEENKIKVQGWVNPIKTIKNEIKNEINEKDTNIDYFNSNCGGKCSNSKGVKNTLNSEVTDRSNYINAAYNSSSANVLQDRSPNSPTKEKYIALVNIEPVEQSGIKNENQNISIHQAEPSRGSQQFEISDDGVSGALKQESFTDDLLHNIQPNIEVCSLETKIRVKHVYEINNNIKKESIVNNTNTSKLSDIQVIESNEVFDLTDNNATKEEKNLIGTNLGDVVIINDEYTIDLTEDTMIKTATNASTVHEYSNVAKAYNAKKIAKYPENEDILDLTDDSFPETLDSLLEFISTKHESPKETITKIKDKEEKLTNANYLETEEIGVNKERTELVDNDFARKVECPLESSIKGNDTEETFAKNNNKNKVIVENKEGIKVIDIAKTLENKSDTSPTKQNINEIKSEKVNMNQGSFTKDTAGEKQFIHLEVKPETSLGKTKSKEEEIKSKFKSTIGDTRTVQVVSNLTKADSVVAGKIESRVCDYLHMKITVTSLIHEGKFSKVFKCKEADGNNYAVKVLTTETDRKLLGMQKEQMLSKIQKDIPKEKLNTIYFINGFGVDRNWCFLMEYYPKNLQTALYALREQPFHIDHVQELTRQLVSAVMLLRNNNVVHSDIKSTHILLNSNCKRLKLCGFDSAYYNNGSVKVLPNIGTTCYRAPEVILGYSAGFSIDVWSTALIIYEMATRTKLFYGCYNNNILYRQMCLMGNMPADIVKTAPYSNHHFAEGVFMKRIGYMGQKTIPVYGFQRTNKLYTMIFNKYNWFWGASRPKVAKAEDLAKIGSLNSLLEQMFVLDPRKRLAIEFVYANPFIFEMFT